MPEPGTAQVFFETGSWTIREGELLAYGRAQDRDIRIADPRVSSRAGLLFMQSGCVLVRHQSFSHSLVIKEPGVRPQVVPRCREGAVGALRQLLSAVCELELVGSAGALQLRVHQRRPLGGPLAVPCAEPTEGLRGELTPDDRRVLAALCQELLRSGGVGEPAITREVAERLGLDKRAGEYRLTRLRTRLAELGVEGLQRTSLGMASDDEPPAAGGENFVAHLGRLAYANGWVLEDDLALLDGAGKAVGGGSAK